MRKVRLLTASIVAFIMGIPMAAQAKAGGAGGILDSSLGLAFSIADVAGDS